MKIALLLDREPFETILEDTLARFLRSTTGIRHRVTWHEGRPRKHAGADSGVGIWLCNPRINALYSTDAKMRVFETPWREYLGGPTFLHTIGHAGYLLAATTPIGRSWMPTHHVRIEPDIEGSKSLLILGGHTRLRWVDFRKGTVTTILKAGFDHDFVRRDIDLRRGRDDLLAPPILEELDEGLAFTEPLIRGSVADRVLSKRRAERAMVAAVDATDRLAASTRHVVGWNDWWSTFRKKCGSAAGRIQGESRGVVRRALDFSDEIGNLVGRRCGVLDDGIEVTLSHGDLQAGNVLVEGARTWLIDWERVDNRVAGYDILTLALESRRGHAGWIERADRLLSGWAQNRFDNRAAEHLPSGVGTGVAVEKLLLYILEEIRFHLEESAAGPLYGPSSSLGELVKELGNLRQSKLVSSASMD